MSSSPSICATVSPSKLSRCLGLKRFDVQKPLIRVQTKLITRILAQKACFAVVFRAGREITDKKQTPKRLIAVVPSNACFGAAMRFGGNRVT